MHKKIDAHMNHKIIQSVSQYMFRVFMLMSHVYASLSMSTCENMAYIASVIHGKES